MTRDLQDTFASNGSRLGRLAACILVGVAFGCEPAEPDPAPPLSGAQGDHYEARILGFAIDKPEAWTFLPESALRRDSDAPSTDMGKVLKRLHRPGIVPLVAMAPQVDASPTRGPVVEVHALPSRPGDVSLFTAGVDAIAPEVILSSRILERGRNPGFQVLEEAQRVELNGHPAAVARLTYRKQGENGDEQPVEELMWHFRRGKVFFYLIQTAPAPLSDDLVETFQGIAHSVRIDS